jgi:P4 family phage/plasmid primase-like protien
MLWVPSASSYIFNAETEEQITGLKGQRLYCVVDDASMIPIIGETIFKRLWLAGHGRIVVGKAGQLLVRTLIDKTVYQPCRLDFAGGANCEEPLVQRRGDPQKISGEAKILEAAKFTFLSEEEEVMYNNMMMAKKHELKPKAKKVRKQRIEERVAELPREKQAEARRRFTKAYEGGELDEDYHVIVLLDGKETDVSVAGLLAEPDKYHGLRGLDPVEPEYNNRDHVAVLNLAQENPNIYSFAHGGQTFFLRRKPKPVLVGASARDSVNRCLDTDMGNAERFYRLACGNVRYVEEKGWLVWNDSYWETSTALAIEAYKAKVVPEIYEEVIKSAAAHDSDASKTLAKWAKRSESSAGVNSAMRSASTMKGIHTDLSEFDQNKWLFTVLNGTIDLKTGKLMAHNKDHLITRQAPVIFAPEAQAPIWEAFLARIFNNDRDIIGFIKRAIGYSLTGFMNEDCWFLCHGSGANGKSVLMKTIQDMMGGYACAGAPGLLMQPRGGSEKHPTELADLQKKRFVVCQESESGDRLAEAALKRITTCDNIKARFMGKDFFEFEPTHKLWLSTNHVPKIRDTTDSTWRRIRLIPFEVVIPPKERDGELLNKLKEEWPGILNWAIEGCLEWQRDKLNAPEKVLKATSEYRKEEDIVAGFLDDVCYEKPGEFTFASDLYAAYHKWCRENGEEPKNQHAFGRAMTEKGYQRTNNGGTRYLDLTLKCDKDGKLTEAWEMHVKETMKPEPDNDLVF